MLKILKTMVSVSRKQLMVVSDSHGKDLSRDLEGKLGGKYIITVVASSGGTFNHVTKNLEELTKGLTKTDHAVLIAGSNDVEDKTHVNIINTFNLDSLRNVAANTNLHIVSIPLRYDKPEHNFNINSINRKLSKVSKEISAASVIDITNFEKTHYTSHGHHLNKRGKLNLAKAIIWQVNKTEGLLTMSSSQDQKNATEEPLVKDEIESTTSTSTAAGRSRAEPNTTSGLCREKDVEGQTMIPVLHHPTTAKNVPHHISVDKTHIVSCDNPNGFSNNDSILRIAQLDLADH